MRARNDPAAEALLLRFRENLRHYVAMSGYSQEEIAFRGEVHRTLISSITRHGGSRKAGPQNPPRDIQLTTLIKLAGALEIEPVLLLEGLNWEPGEFRPGAFKVALKTLLRDQGAVLGPFDEPTA